MIFYYGWLILAVAFINLLTFYGIWYSYSVLMVYIAYDFGWERTTVSCFFSLFMVTIGLTGPIVGYCVDKIGSRVVLSVGAVLLGSGLLLCSLAQSRIDFYIWFGLVTGLGGSCIGLSGNTKAVSSWFVTRKGMAAGIVTSGISAGLLFFVPIMQYWVENYGWRSGFWYLGVLVSVLVFPINALLPKKNPNEVLDNIPKENSIITQKRKSRKGSNFIKKIKFWQIFLIFFLGGLVVQGTLIHQVAMTKDAGFTASQTYLVFATLGFWGMIGRSIWGLLADRLGSPVSYITASIIMILGLSAILTATVIQNLNLLYVYAFFFGLGYSAVAPINWTIAIDLFSGSNFGIIYGLLFSGTALGASLGPILSGYVYDIFTNYVVAYTFLVLMIVLSCVTLYFVCHRLPNKVS
jgi:MFS family permease